jgi:hypothetical protein
MHKLIAALVMLATPASPPAPAQPAAAPPAAAEEKKEAFGLIDSAELEKRLSAKDSKVRVFDVNNPDFRKENGMVPGATPLASFDKYTAADLPADKGTPLVFYCVNTH